MSPLKVDLLAPVVVVELVVCPALPRLARLPRLLLRPRPIAAAAALVVDSSVVLISICEVFQVVRCAPRFDSVVGYEVHLFAVQVCHCRNLRQFFLPNDITRPGRRLFKAFLTLTRSPFSNSFEAAAVAPTMGSCSFRAAFSCVTRICRACTCAIKCSICWSLSIGCQNCSNDHCVSKANFYLKTML